MPKILVLAAPASSAGKTTVTLALLAALVRRGLAVQSFKVGPDFIDPALHAAVTGRPALNLDAWIYGRKACRKLAAGALSLSPRPDVFVVEGVMGLFDGVSGLTEEGSTAQMAKWLGAPVALVVDSRAQGRSVAALVKGFASFDPDLSLPFVICNKTGSDRHREMLTQALRASRPGVSLLGCLPRNDAIRLPSRHLGLHTAAEGVLSPDLVQSLARWLEENLDLEGLLAALPEYDPGRDAVQTGAGFPDAAPVNAAPEKAAPENPPPSCARPRKRVPQESPRPESPRPESPRPESPRPENPRLPRARIAVARDRAFCFHAAANEDLLRAAGGEPVFFSPLEDDRLPPGVHGLILGGGYPELYAPQLSANRSMLDSIKAFAAGGKPVWAACGGFMYLMEKLVDQAGAIHCMAGLFPFTAAMRDSLQSLGYRQTVLEGHTLRGHEFRYSSLTEESLEQAQALAISGLTDARGRDLGPGVFRAPGLDHCYGTYMHVHLGSAPGAAKEFIRRCLACGLSEG